MSRAAKVSLLVALGFAAAARADLAAVAARFAPILRQDTASPEDYITRFDFDGDFDGGNNWANQPDFPNAAAVYWAGLETETHVFLTYAIFHPRDWTVVNNPLLSHENDLEGCLLALERRDGALVPVAFETIFHFEFKRYQVPGGYPVEAGDGPLVLEGGERPVLAIEAKGHGVEAWRAGEDFPGGDGVVYRFKGVAEVPEHPDDRDVGYELLEIAPAFWDRRYQVGPGKTFGKTATIGGDTVGYAFYGKRYGDHKALAPWGWAAEGLARGALFLDPAGTIAAHYQVPAEYGGEYRPNPFTESPLGRDVRRRVRFRAPIPARNSAPGPRPRTPPESAAGSAP